MAILSKATLEVTSKEHIVEWLSVNYRAGNLLTVQVYALHVSCIFLAMSRCIPAKPRVASLYSAKSRVCLAANIRYLLRTAEPNTNYATLIT